MPDTPKLFDPSALSIKDLFDGENALYAIPPYQRPYRWMDDEVNSLWDDLKNAYDNSNKEENSHEESYFLGSIITVKHPNKDYVDVVDGQQRLTTLIILFAVLRDFCPEINKDCEGAIKAQDIENSITLKTDFPRLKINNRLYPSENIVIYFLNHVLKPGATAPADSDKPIDKKKLKGDDPKENFINSVRILRKKVKSEKKEYLGKFINFIFNQVQIIKIDCKNVYSAITLFQVLNDRGMDLRSSDLVKSFLLGQIDITYKGDTEGLDKAKKKFIADWYSMEKSVADDQNESITMDDMLSFYMCFLLAKPPGKDLFKKFEKRNPPLEKTIPDKTLDSFRTFSEKHDDLFQKDKALYALRYTKWDMLWKSILLTALHLGCSDDDFIQLAGVLRRYYYVCWIAGKSLTAVKTPSFKVIEKIKSNKDKGETFPDIISEIDDELRNLVNSDDSDNILKAAKDKLKLDKIDKEPWVKPLLLLINYNVEDDILAFKRISDCHLEHVLPKRHNKEKWQHIVPSVASNYLKSGGNLTLLSRKKNILASNSSFSDKIRVYKGDGEPGGRPTAFRITERIVQDYNNNNYGKKWNEKAMCDRKKWFLDEVFKILDIEE